MFYRVKENLKWIYDNAFKKYKKYVPEVNRNPIQYYHNKKCKKIELRSLKKKKSMRVYPDCRIKKNKYRKKCENQKTKPTPKKPAKKKRRGKKKRNTKGKKRTRRKRRRGRRGKRGRRGRWGRPNDNRHKGEDEWYYEDYDNSTDSLAIQPTNHNETQVYDEDSLNPDNEEYDDSDTSGSGEEIYDEGSTDQATNGPQAYVGNDHVPILMSTTEEVTDQSQRDAPEAYAGSSTDHVTLTPSEVNDQSINGGA